MAFVGPGTFALLGPFLNKKMFIFYDCVGIKMNILY